MTDQTTPARSLDQLIDDCRYGDPVAARAAIHEHFNRRCESAAPSERTQSDLIDALAETVAQGSVLLKVQTDMHGDPGSYRIGVQYLGESDHREYVSNDFESALWNAVEDAGALAEEEKRLMLWGELDNPPTEEVEALVACLGDDAAQLRQDNSEDERAQTMDDAADMLTRLELANRQLFQQGCTMYAKLTAAPTAPAEPIPAPGKAVNHIGLTCLAWGVTRMGDNPKAILVSFRSEPTDDDLRALHDALRPVNGGAIIRAASPAPAPEAATPSDDALTALIADLEYRARFWRQPGAGDVAVKDCAEDFAIEIDRAIAALRTRLASPPQSRVPLTIDQIHKLWVLNGGPLNGNNYEGFVRVIEAAHGIVAGKDGA